MYMYVVYPASILLKSTSNRNLSDMISEYGPIQILVEWLCRTDNGTIQI